MKLSHSFDIIYIYVYIILKISYSLLKGQKIRNNSNYKCDALCHYHITQHKTQVLYNSIMMEWTVT